MNSITELFIRLGQGLFDLIRSENALYGIYLVSFLFAIYALFGYVLREKVSLFEGNGRKAANVVALMVSIISTGAIFYGARSPRELLALFHSFGGFIVVLIIAIAFGGGSIFLYNKYKESNFKFAMLCLTLGFYITFSLLLPQFSMSFQTSSVFGVSGSISDSYGKTYFVYTLTQSDSAAMQRVGQSLGVLGGIISILQSISFLLFIVYLVMVIIDLFKSGNGSSYQSMAKRIDGKEENNKKDIKAAKGLLGDVINELKEINNHFNNKIHMLNELRTRVIPSVETTIRQGDVAEQQQERANAQAAAVVAAQSDNGGQQNV